MKRNWRFPTVDLTLLGFLQTSPGFPSHFPPLHLLESHPNDVTKDHVDED